MHFIDYIIVRKLAQVKTFYSDVNLKQTNSTSEAPVDGNQILQEVWSVHMHECDGLLFGA